MRGRDGVGGESESEREREREREVLDFILHKDLGYHISNITNPL